MFPILTDRNNISKWIHQNNSQKRSIKGTERLNKQIAGGDLQSGVLIPCDISRSEPLNIVYIS